MKEIIKLYLILTKSNKKFILSMLLFSVVITIFSVIPAQLTGQIIDSATNSDMTGIQNNFRWLVIITIIICVLNILKSVINKHLSCNIDKRFKLNILNKIFKAPSSFFQQEKRAEILQVMNSDVGALESIGIDVVPNFASELFYAISAIILISNLYYPIVIIGILIYAIYLIPIRKFGAIQQKMVNKLRESNVSIKQAFLESIEDIRNIKVYGNEGLKTKQYEKLQEGWMDNLVERYKSDNVFKNFPRVLNALAPAVVFIVGGIQVFNGTLTLGNLITITALLPAINGPIRSFTSFFMTIKTLRPSLSKVESYLNLPAESSIENQCAYSGLKEKIVFKDIGVQNERGHILENISFEINKGEKIAIVGPTGSGKTTIFKLILKLIEAESGDIFFDNCSVNNIEADSLRKSIGVVLQNTYLFHETVSYNINYLNTDKKSLIDYICKGLELTDLIAEDKDVGESGNKLSDGQRQRIGIARALLSNFDILLLDEHTSSIDIEDRKNICDFIFHEYAADKTIIYITHNLNTLDYADKVIYINNGNLECCGDHKNLYYSNPEYKQMIDSVIND